MTSLQIAEVAEKPHNDVMKAIRRMEKAWEKVCGRKFSLTSQDVAMPNGGYRQEPCYELTKTECLYIATKFNDEARARLILRWEQLESERMAKNVNVVDLLDDSKSISIELQQEAIKEKYLPVKSAYLSVNALTLYSYICRNIPADAESFPFISTKEGEMHATGLTREQLAEAWSELEKLRYIITRDADYGKVFILNPNNH